MGFFECDKKSLSLNGLKEEISLVVTSRPKDVLSVDIYGVPPFHPANHLGYWNFKLPQEEVHIKLRMDFNELSFDSIKSCYKSGELYYEDFWINPEFMFENELKLSIVLWRNGEIKDISEFKILLNEEAQKKLQESLNRLQRLDENEVYVKHFCEDRIPLPQLLVIESTSRCNLKCSMCPRSIDKSPTGDFADLDESILDNLENAIKNCNSVCLSWMGEPLVNNRLEEIAKRIKDINKRVLITITTNGLLLDEERAKKLIRSGIDVISFSIDSAKDEIYRKIRVGGSLNQVKENIRNLTRLKKSMLSFRPIINIAYVGGEENIDQISGIVRMADELGIRSVSLAPIDDFTLTAEYENRLSFSEEVKKRGQESFYQAENLSRQKGIKLSYEMPIQFFNLLDIQKPEYAVDKSLFNNDVINEDIKKLGLQKGCYVPWLHSFIAHNGDVHSCCISPRVLGNLNENTFEEIWCGEKYREFRRRLRSHNPNEECRRCRRVVWNKSEFIESLKDWMEVGRHEIHGLGWSAIEEDDSGMKYRIICKKATLFLRDSKKQYIALTLGNEGIKIARAKIFVNDEEIGEVFVPNGWNTVYFNLSNKRLLLFSSNINKENILKVDILLKTSNMKLKISNIKLMLKEEVSLFHKLLMYMHNRGFFNPFFKLVALLSYVKHFKLLIKKL